MSITAELTFLAAVIAGLAGSGHCLAMCGGMASLHSARHNARPLLDTLLYNSGRLVSYSTGGLLVAGLGEVAGLREGLAILGVNLRIIAGGIIVLAGLYLLTGKQLFAPFEKIGARFWQLILPLAGKALRSDGRASLLGLGLLWGWLPCGLVYSMLALAASSADAVQGMTIMFGFGLGTLPAMVATGLAGLKLKGLLNRKGVRRFAAGFLIVAGVWTAMFPLLGSHAGQHGPNKENGHESQVMPQGEDMHSPHSGHH